MRLCQNKLKVPMATWLCYTSGVIETFCSLAKLSFNMYAGAQWPSGKVLDQWAAGSSLTDITFLVP